MSLCSRELKISEMMQEQSSRDDAASIVITYIIHSFVHKNPLHHVQEIII